MLEKGFFRQHLGQAVITLLGVCRLTHRQSYFDIFMVSMVISLSALMVVIALGTLFGNF